MWRLFERSLYPPRLLLRMPGSVTAEVAARLPRSQAAGALSSADARGYTGKTSSSGASNFARTAHQRQVCE